MAKAKTSTHVVFLLDKSGSMESVRAATISGFNEYIQSLKKQDRDYEFSLTLFDTSMSQPYTNEPIKNVKKLSNDNYDPDGGTSLYDAIGNTIESIERSWRWLGGGGMSECDRCGQLYPKQKILFVIMTDGEENSSRFYDRDQIFRRISALKEKGNWSFVFMGANQDSYVAAQKFGISLQNATNYHATARGMGASFSALAANTVAFSNSANTNTNAFFTKAQQKSLEDTQ